MSPNVCAPMRWMVPWVALRREFRHQWSGRRWQRKLQKKRHVKCWNKLYVLWNHNHNDQSEARVFKYGKVTSMHALSSNVKTRFATECSHNNRNLPVLLTIDERRILSPQSTHRILHGQNTEIHAVHCLSFTQGTTLANCRNTFQHFRIHAHSKALY